MSYHSARHTKDPRRAIVWRELTRYLQEKFTFGDVVLDLGCGYGDFINHVNADTRIGIDHSSEMETNLSKGVNFYQLTLPGKLPVPDSSVDTIFASNILEHLSHEAIDYTLTEAHRALKSGGLFMVLGPNFQRAFRNYFDDYTHLTALSHTSLNDWMVSRGFKTEYTHPGFMPYSIKDSHLPITGWLVRAWLASPVKPGGAQMLVVGRKK